jgi:hypothetical protein
MEAFMIKSCSGMLKEISSGTTKDLEDIDDSRYSAVAEDIMSTNLAVTIKKVTDLLLFRA